MVGKKEVRWITSDPMEAQKAAAKHYCQIHQVFHTQDEAESWIGEEEGTDNEDPPRPQSKKARGYLSDSDKDSSDPDVDVAGAAKVAHHRKKNQAHRVRKQREAKESKGKSER
jgi:hypothetical protein